MVMVWTVEDRLAAGHGRITCSLNGVSVVFSELSSTYPLKLLSPRLAHNDVAIVYVMNYGGGLVCGDRIKLQVRAEGGSRLLLLSQGSTKVFKVRSPNRSSAHLGNPTDGNPLENNATTQLMDVHVAPTSAVGFYLSKGASMVLLDWFTSGRKSLGEEWVFSRYFSVNEVNVDGRRIAKDIMLLEEPLHDDTVIGTRWPSSRRSLSDRLKPYSCYATLIVCGPLVHGVVAQLKDKLRSLSVLAMVAPPRVLWGMTPADDGNIFVIRVAGLETEDVKDWLRESLRPLEEVVGIDTYRKAFT
ncbi:UreD-domain-containing protein [Pisolithus croceorrhizus]|nr:UreD-domain-containing protein [Pisolithus croceorrhizus]